MKKIILHVGMHKTGSTSIQSSLSGFDSGVMAYLNLPSVDPYLDITRYNHSHFLYLAFAEKFYEIPALVKQGLRYDDLVEKRNWCRSTLLKTLRASRADTAIISAEAILDLEISGLSELKQSLDTWADVIDVYAYVRSPWQFVASATNQIIKSGYGAEHVHSVSYRRYFQKIEETFSRERVNYRVFDRTQLIDGDVVADFLNWIGLDEHLGSSVQSHEENISLSTGATACVYALNSGKIPSYGDRVLTKARGQVIDWLKQMFPGKFELPEALLRTGYELEDVNWINARLENKFSEIDPCKTSLNSDGLSSVFKLYEPEITPVIKQKIIEFGGQVPDHVGLDWLMAQLYLEFLRETGADMYDYRRFDPKRYLDLYADVEAAGVDPFGHFLQYGRNEGRDACWRVQS